MRISCIYLIFLIPANLLAIDLAGSLLGHAPSALMTLYLGFRPERVKSTAERHPYLTTALVTFGWAAEHARNVSEHYQGSLGSVLFYGADTALTIVTGATLIDLVCFQRNSVINCFLPSGWRPDTEEPAPRSWLDRCRGV